MCFTFEREDDHMWQEVKFGNYVLMVVHKDKLLYFPGSVWVSFLEGRRKKVQTKL